MLPQTEKLLFLMQQASGFSQDEILSQSRKAPLPACRYFVGAELMNMGFSSMVVSRELGIDHATLLHGRKMIASMTERNGWKTEKLILDKFKELLDADR